MPTHDFKTIGEVLDYGLLQGTILSIDSTTDTCTVSVGGVVLAALLFYHCTSTSGLRDNGAIEGAAKGFKVGDQVIVLRKNDDSSIKIIAHIDGIRNCTSGDENYYVFYLDSGKLKIANLRYTDSGTYEIVKTLNYGEVGMYNNTNPFTFHVKRFTHNVPANGVTTARDLYFVSTSLLINTAPYYGWTNFAAANPTFGLVTNNSNTQLTYSEDLMNVLTSVNTEVNTTHTYQGDRGSDNWNIMADGQPGDCEDFALTKANKLLSLGYPASAIHIESGWPEGTVPVDNKMIGHAWLVVQTTAGDYALDISSNALIRNSALRNSQGKDYVCRRRQIGSNWAFISPFGWTGNCANNYGFYYDYILDPLLNIFYPISFSSNKAPLALTRSLFFANFHSANFSEDNNSIYISGDPAGTGSYFTAKYKLNENSLSLVSTTSLTLPGVVNRDGSVVYHSTFNAEIKSANGYYEQQSDEIGTNEHILPFIGQSKSFGNKFYETNGNVLHTPWGESIAMADSGLYASPWAQIDTDKLLIQSLNYLNTKRLYKDDSSILSNILSLLGTSQGNLSGFTYIPSTNRLN